MERQLSYSKVLFADDSVYCFVASVFKCKRTLLYGSCQYYNYNEQLASKQVRDDVALNTMILKKNGKEKNEISNINIFFVDVHLVCKFGWTQYRRYVDNITIFTKWVEQVACIDKKYYNKGEEGILGSVRPLESETRKREGMRAWK